MSLKDEMRQSVEHDGLGTEFYGPKYEMWQSVQEGRYKATWKGGFKLPWREAGPPNHLDDEVHSNQ